MQPLLLLQLLEQYPLLLHVCHIAKSSFSATHFAVAYRYGVLVVLVMSSLISFCYIPYLECIAQHKKSTAGGNALLSLTMPNPTYMSFQLSVGLPNQTVLDGQFLFFSDHYDIALLEIDAGFQLQRPSIVSGPNYGQEVFVLARDEELSLRARHGEILWLEESDYVNHNYQMFLSCEVPVVMNISLSFRNVFFLIAHLTQ
jgi:hypothetical protein